MDWEKLEKHFSAARMARYCMQRGGCRTLASDDYRANLLIAGALMPVLQVLEIALRNGITGRLTEKYGTADWWSGWIGNPAYASQLKDIAAAREKLRRRGEHASPDKIVAELTFGFWATLFNARLQDDLWKDLRLVFPHCPKAMRKRHEVSSALNQMRLLRNRVFHHEPLLWLAPPLVDQHSLGRQAIQWIDPQLANWLDDLDALPSLWADKVS
ncbi:hypothetical protein [Luteibacter yeojuensis]|uniref:Abi-like protein n=1 Tax=Luteibacter yeojuensis TaxID=345309 RepID=A0A0F3KYT2_9GAMM|nr:hypothetical protein [Luteibacter yeojuensis]KJV35274.1 hypothetical protein VI08_08235 [Luteibacter yeojuensis]